MPQRTLPPDQGGFSLPMQTRSLPVSTINEERRSVDLVWTTGASVLRYDWVRERYYLEELSTDPAHIRLERLNGGAPLLNAHSSWSLSDQIGVVERAWMDSGQGMSTVRFSSRDDVEPLFRDVRDGIIRNVSVGYRIHRVEMIPPETEGGRWVYRAVDWEPYEISLVPVPADAGCGTRGESMPDQQRTTYPVECLEPAPAAETRDQPADNAATEEQQMDEQEQQRQEQERLTAARAEAVRQERARQTEIRSLCDPHNLGDEFVRGLIEGDTTVDAARAAILNELATRSEQNPIRGHHIETVRDETETRRSAMQEVIHHRAFGGELPETARHYRGMDLADLARECVEAAGGKVRGLTRAEIVELALNNNRGYGMHTTSDFPVILANEANRSMLRGYELAGQTFRPLVREVSAPDFKDVVKLRLGNQVELKEVDEAGEFEIGNLNDAETERYKLRTYGRIVNISRQTIINDDLGVFNDAAFGFGRSAANLESNLVWGLIINNQKLGDGKALFHSGHGNIAGTVGSITIDNIDALDQLIGAQKEPQTGDDLNLYGKYLLVPRSLRLAALKAIGFVSATKVDDLNPLAGQYQIIAEPRLSRASAARWYLAAGPESAPTIDLAYLEGQKGVYTTSREGFEVDGVQVKGRIDVGVGLLDYRWIATNPGA